MTTPTQERAAWQAIRDQQIADDIPVAPDPFYVADARDAALKWANSWTNSFPMSLSKPPANLNAPSCKGKWIRPKGLESRGTILYVRGANETGTALSYCRYARDICAATQADVLVLAYRSAPERRYDAPYRDVLNALVYLFNNGHDPATTILAGDSFGCPPALAALVNRKARRQAAIAGLYMLSPLVEPNSHLDQPPPSPNPLVCLRADASRGYYGVSYGGVAWNDPRAMPYNSNLSGLPPTLMHRTDGENSPSFLQWQRDLSNKLVAAGNAHTQYEWDTVPHIFPFYGNAFAYGATALTALGAWFNDLVT